MRPSANDRPSALDALINFDDSDFNPEVTVERMAAARQDADVSRQLDLSLMDRLYCQQQGLRKAKELHGRLEEVIEKFKAPPLFPAMFIMLVPSANGPRAYVRQGATERIVGFGEGVDGADLRLGDAVYLTHELNVIVGRAPGELNRTGETCSFERWTDDGRIVIKARDEEYVIYALPALAKADLKPGNLLRWDRTTMLANERIERSNGSQFFLEETPRESFAEIGGLGPQIACINSALLLHFKHREIACSYRLRPKGSILLHGPAGTGKTLMAKALANQLARMASGGRSFFMNIKPAALHSMWYSQSEANYREVFRVARETAAAHPGSIVLMFFDEVDAIGGARGTAQMRVNDNVLTAFLAELDGLAERGDVLVVGATNRRDALDPALLRPGRLGDLVIEIPRPNRKAARDIFCKHLPADIPYARNGHGDDFSATRAEIIDAAVSTIFSPNADNELATITFRDGKHRPIRAADLVTGAVIANITRNAAERACLRDAETGEGGVMWSDVALAIEHEFETAASALTPGNCRNHLAGLPHDLDIVNVEPAPRKVAHPQRYLNVA